MFLSVDCFPVDLMYITLVDHVFIFTLSVFLLVLFVARLHRTQHRWATYRERSTAVCCCCFCFCFLLCFLFGSRGRETSLVTGGQRTNGGRDNAVCYCCFFCVFFVDFIFVPVLVVTRPYCTLHRWATDGGREVHGSLTEAVGGAALPLTKILKIH